MYKFKGKTKHFKKDIRGQESLWFTFKDGAVVPNDLKDLVLAQGGELVESVPKPEPIKVVEPNKAVKKKAKKKVTKKKESKE